MVYQYRHRYCYTTIHTAIMLACIPLFTLAAGLQEEGKVPTSAIFLWGVPFNFGVPCRQIPRLARSGPQGWGLPYRLAMFPKPNEEARHLHLPEAPDREPHLLAAATG